MRIFENPALDVAIEAANLLGLPVVVFFSVIPNYPNANLRHYHFLAQGLRDVAEDAAERGVGFVLRRPPDNSLETFLEEVEAALLDRRRESLPRARTLAQGAARRSSGAVTGPWMPTSSCPRAFSVAAFFCCTTSARTSKRHCPNSWSRRRKDQSAPHHGSPEVARKLFARTTTSPPGSHDLIAPSGPSTAFTGGTHAALKRLKEFVHHDLAGYEITRNHPELQGTSRLSPYLHFGNIGPLTIALAVEEAVKQGKATAAARDRFLDQVIGWRELSVLFVRHTPDYDNWECAEPWARKTLIEHAGRCRVRIATLCRTTGTR